MRAFLSNLAWFVSTLPDAIRFWRALGNPARSQWTVAALCPTVERNGYRLLWEPADGGRLPSVSEVETLLCGNYHYEHARNLGQLVQVRVERIEDGLSRWCAARGTMEAVAKVPCLQTPKML